MTDATAGSPIAADTMPRHLQWEGTFNVRDVGGYAADGGTTRWRRLLRGDSLTYLTDTGRTALTEAGVRAIIDLRTTSEREHFPSALPQGGITVHPSPLFEFKADVAGVPTGAVSLEEIYRNLVDQSGPRIAAAITLLTQPTTLPAVVHCTAGKDRTGMVIALLLSALGVSDDDVAVDYAASRQHLSGGFLDRVRDQHTAHGVAFSDEHAEMYVGSQAELMHATLERLRKAHGSAADYLQSHGLGDTQLTALHATLVEPTR